MTFPDPRPGLVIRYAYLWHREALVGREDAVKDRPCAVVLSVRTDDTGTRVYVLPITHSPHLVATSGVEIPATVKARLQLDGQRSWVVVNEANVFSWPGPDLRFLPGMGPASVVYGFLPPAFLRVVRDRFLAAGRERKPRLVPRTE